MLRKRQLGIACVLTSLLLGGLSLGAFMEEAANAAVFFVPSWVGAVVAVVLFFVGIELAAPERRERW